MVTVMLGGPLRIAAGVNEVDVEASNIRELLAGLAAIHPKLQPIIDKGVAVSVDGQIYRDNWFQPITPDSEVHVLMPLAGG